MYSQDIKVKGLLVFMTVITYFLLAYIKKPYKNETITNCDNLGSICAGLSILFSIFIY